MEATRCPSCAKAPNPLRVTMDGHAVVHGSTGLAIACSADGGYAPRPRWINCGLCGTTVLRHPDEDARALKFCASCAFKPAARSAIAQAKGGGA